MQSDLVQVLARRHTHTARQARTDPNRTTATSFAAIHGGRYPMAKQTNAAASAHVVEGFRSADHASRL